MGSATQQNAQHAMRARPGLGDNFDDFRRSMLEWHFAWDMRRQSADHFRGDTSCRTYDGVILADFAFDALRGVRTHAAIRQSTDDYIGLALIQNGGELYSQDGKEVLTRPRELLLWDLMRPATILSGPRTQLLNMLFPRALVLQHVPNIDDLSCMKIGPETGNGVILASHVATVHQMIDTVPAENRMRIFRATLELLASCFRPDEQGFGKTGYQNALLRKVEQYARETLFEPDFGVASIADHFHVTPRYMHRLFSRSGVSFSEWVRNERLARAHRALTSPSFAAESITQLALRFGFCDAAHFSRSFKAKYGCSPKRFRTSQG